MSKEIRILIADDDEGMRESLGDILESSDCSIDKVDCGEDAVLKVKKEKYDLVFLDMKLPGIDGWESFVRIKSANPDVEVVLMTAYVNEYGNLGERALRSGVHSCLYKPFHPGKALDIVEKIAKEKT